MDLFRYAAFISYSSKDARFAKRLHRALESYGIPIALGRFDIIGGGKKNRIYPVFRDREELTAGGLGERLHAALRASANLIVICSPHAAASPWVEAEIRYFAEIGKADRIFTIIPTGAPLRTESGGDATPTCFPPALRGDALTGAGAAAEPLAADARPAKDGFRNALLKLVAGIIGVSLGQVVDRDRAMRRARRLYVGGAALAALLGAAVALASLDVVQSRGVAESYARALIRGAGADSRAPPIFGEFFGARGRPLQAAPFALAGAAPMGALLPSSSRGARTLDETGLGAPLSARFGMIREISAAPASDRLLIVEPDDPQDASVWRFFNRRGPLAERSSRRDGARTLVWDLSDRSAALSIDEWPAIDRGGFFRRDRMRGLELSPDGQRFAAIFESGVAGLWDVDAKTRIANFGAGARSIVAAPDHSLYAIVNSQGVALHDGRSGALRLSVPGAETASAMSPRGRFVVLGRLGHAELHDVFAGALRARVPLTRLEAAEFSTDGGHVLIAGLADERAAVHLLDAADGRSHPLGLGGEGLQVEFVLHGARVAGFDADGRFIIYDLINGRFLVRQDRSAVVSMSWRADARLLVTIGEDKAVKVWDVETGLLIDEKAGQLQDDSALRPDALWSKDGRRLAVNFAAAGARLYDENGVVLRSFEPGRRIWLGRNGEAFYAEGEDGAFVRLDAETGADVFSLGPLLVGTGPSGEEEPLVFDIGDRILAAQSDGLLRLWTRSGAEIATLDQVAGGAFAGAIQAGPWIIVQSETETAVFDQAGGRRVVRLGGPNTVAIREVGPDGSWVLGQSGDGFLLFDLRDLDAPANATAARVCQANGRFVGAFPEEARQGDLRRVLAGRPWHPCDWRGLGAILPNRERGDGWLEGPRQWLRLMQVRYFGGEDWACAETTTRASAETRRARADMCERFAGSAAAPSPAGP